VGIANGALPLQERVEQIQVNLYTCTS
jgi:hypothetical protein